MGFILNKNAHFVDSTPIENQGMCFSLKDEVTNPKLLKRYISDVKAHDANFAFLSTTLAKLHEKLYEPKTFVTYAKDMPINVGGGFVDYVEYYSVDWAGILSESRNIVGNNSNIMPRVNASMNQMKADVYTYEIGYDLNFIELEKAKQLTLQKSIEQIYKDAIVAGWDLFVQDIAYVGIHGKTGLFNNPNVMVTAIPNSTATGKGFIGMDDEAVVSFFNGVFELYLSESNNNITILPDTFLLPTFVSKDLTGRFSALYTSSLREYIKNHNLGIDESDGELTIKIFGRPALNDMNNGKGRIVAYRHDADYVRLDMPYPLQHYITLPNMERMCYTTAFVGQVSEVQMPYNTSDDELGVVTYWDFAK